MKLAGNPLGLLVVFVLLCIAISYDNEPGMRTFWGVCSLVLSIV